MDLKNGTLRLFSLLVALFWLPYSATAQSSANWSEVMPQTNPPGRNQHALAYDSAHSQVVLFGGNSGDPNNPLGDTWVWDATNWTKGSPQKSPAARFSHSLAYDSAHQQTVLFGGLPALFNDTWVWDGKNWTQMNPTTSPPPRYAQAMAYDSAHGQTVLFGGQTIKVVLLNDTWTWDGANWNQKSPASSPSARYFTAMAFDSTHGQVVLFGGSNANGTVYGDTWVWDGTNWTQKSPPSSPPARQGHAMTYDSVHGQVILFGGVSADGSTILGDTWTWDGTNWTQQAPVASPPARNASALAYDSTHSQAVLFGGYTSTYANDTWIWQGGPASGSLPSISNIISASGFGGFSAVAPGTWVEIYGSNLAPDTRQWASSDFNGNNAPTSLDGVQVSIGGVKAFIDYISAGPGQINAQLPSNIASGGQLPVTVSNTSGTSQAFNLTVNATEPGLLAPSSFLIGGNQYVVALLPDGATYILPTGAISGVTSRPAHPGETITLYGIGFGPVTPSIAAGQIVTGNNQLAASFQVFFGQTGAQVSYDGLSPGFVGLYQFDVVVPSVADNDLVPLTFNLGGVAGTQTLYTAVHQ